MQVHAVQRFLGYLNEHGVSLDDIDADHVAAYWRERRLAHERDCHDLRMSTRRWHRHGRAAVQRYLREARGVLPERPAPVGSPAALAAVIVDDYRRHLLTTRDLATGTLDGRLQEAGSFLRWCERRALLTGSRLACVASDIDAYQRDRAATVRRTTRSSISRRLRETLRFLHRSGRLPVDFSSRVISPRQYRDADVPAILTDAQVQQVLKVTRTDRSAKGRRDFAMLTLLATYGLRSGELVRLRLDDVDWRQEAIRIVHSKTRDVTVVPLLPHVGTALLAYLQHGRPSTAARQIFVRVRAPYGGLRERGALHNVVAARLHAAGIDRARKRGPHLFRHARAVSLLRAKVPVKAIADVLGHRSMRSTAAYLRLQDDDLRAIALSLPTIQEVAHERVA
ncbi:MAG: tyrosine-type recombinase/integrase [Gammaproteobacteria bacterium]